jgi:hypothetical protein
MNFQSSNTRPTPIRLGVSVVCLALLLTGCGEFPAITDPVGDPLLPDLVPEPPVDLRVTKRDDGGVEVRFSSTLVNVGDGEFVLRADRNSERWLVQQELWYSEGGAEIVETDARMAYAGDGHHHWHIRRVASYSLVPTDDSGNPVEVAVPRMDSKIGFCFYDHSHSMEFGPDEALYEVDGCGSQDDTQVRMGLSSGWADVYGFSLPGQSIDITDLPDGEYRLWAEADTDGWFTEADRTNNVTWIDFELMTDAEGRRFADLRDVGPEPTVPEDSP